MDLTFTNAEKGKPFRLSETIDNVKNLKIGLKKVSGRVGWYNVEKELVWRYYVNRVKFGEPTIQPGLYSFDDLVKLFTSEINGETEVLRITADDKSGIISLTVPEHYELKFPDRVKELFGLDDAGRLSGEIGEYVEDRPIEFSPQRIAIYLKQLSTTDNLLNGRGTRLLGYIPLTKSPFGGYFRRAFHSLDSKTSRTDRFTSSTLILKSSSGVRASN